MVATGPNGETAESNVNSFTTESSDSNIPAPTSPTPESGKNNIATSTTLGWSDVGADSYKIYFGSSQNPDYYSSTSSSSVSVSGLDRGQTYYWKVVAVNGGTETSSNTWSFTTTDATGSVDITNLQFKNEDQDSPLKIKGGSHPVLRKDTWSIKCKPITMVKITTFAS